MALSKIDVANMLTGSTPVANGGTALTSGFKNGVTMADIWRVNSSFTGDATPITSNWERADTDGYGQLGTGMAESSGIFTFPSTGIYKIKFTATFYLNGDTYWNNIGIDTTTDNSSYNTASDALDGSKSAGDTTYCNAVCECIFDVTNVSTHKVRVKSSVQNNNSTTYGDSNANTTFISFIRLGDT